MNPCPIGLSSTINSSKLIFFLVKHGLTDSELPISLSRLRLNARSKRNDYGMPSKV